MTATFEAKPSPTPQLPSLEELEAAAEIIRPILPPTPQYSWPLLCRRTGTEVWVKHENHLPVGAFKVRGGLVYINDLKRRQPDCRGIVSATRGNHGQSLAFACARRGLPCVIVVPHGNSREKNEAMRALGADLVEHGRDFQDAVDHLDTLVAERGLERVPSFHPLLVQGVGTYSLEFLRARPDLETVYVPIGLGSGICGMIAAREALGLTTEIVGVVSTGAPCYALSFAQGRPISTNQAATELADGMACRTPVAEAVAIINAYVDRIVEVTDEEIAHAMRAFFADTHNVAEGAGAAGLAALMQEQERQRGRKVGVVMTGGNVDATMFGEVLTDGKP
ncbi:MAG: threonine dehydratase [Pseudomonadota bacterium]